MLSTALRNPHFRLFAGAFSISFSPVFVNLVEVPATTSGFYRMLFGGCALGIFLTVTRRWRRLGRGAWIALVGAALFFSLDLWSWHRSILLIGPGLSTLLANLQVFFMIAAGVLLFRERPGFLQWLAAPLAVAGLVLMLGRDWLGLVPGYRLGVLLGLLTAMSYAGYLLSLRQARLNAEGAVPAVEVAVVSLLVASILGVAAAAEGNSLAIPSLGDFVWLAAYGVLAHSIGSMLIVSSLNQVTATEAGIALLLQPSLSLLWDVLFFARPVSAIELLGAALTLAAIFLGSQRRQAGPQQS
jgi:drug/metabolite transporter (DMT)-like permease